MKMVSHTLGAHSALIGLRLDSLNVNFNATLEMDSGTAKIVLSAELDASVAQVFRQAIERIASSKMTS
jgi:hypothetical protein